MANNSPGHGSGVGWCAEEKNMQKLLFLLGLCFVAVMANAGHHLNGTWKLNVTLSGQQGGTATFELVEGAGGVLSGTYSGAAGTADIAGTVDGANVEFSFDSQAGKVTYIGSVTAGRFAGTCSYGMIGDGTFEGEKE
jgi:hypothetical protein